MNYFPAIKVVRDRVVGGAGVVGIQFVAFVIFKLIWIILLVKVMFKK